MEQYSSKVMEHFAQPHNVGEIENADGVGTVGNPVCGDVMRLYLRIEDGKITDARKNGSIIMLDRELKEAARWNFTNAWPSKVSGPAPKADGNEIAIEELTIVHEFIERVK